jgi:hypothetical protein
LTYFKGKPFLTFYIELISSLEPKTSFAKEIAKNKEKPILYFFPSIFPAMELEVYPSSILSSKFPADFVSVILWFNFYSISMETFGQPIYGLGSFPEWAVQDLSK